MSISSDSTIEHIFAQIPTTGEYEFWVHRFGNEFGGLDHYAVAWWAMTAIGTSQGDYNGDQIVDTEDYNTWSEQFGQGTTPGVGADGNGDGSVNAADYVVWRKAFEAVGSGGFPQVPEPSGLLLIALGCLLFASRRSTAIFESCAENDPCLAES